MAPSSPDAAAGALDGTGAWVGAAVGARLLPHISQPLLRRIFSLLILLSALRLWFR